MQVIDQHKEDFNPDNLRDFIDMFLLEVLKLVCVFKEWGILVTALIVATMVLQCILYEFSGQQEQGGFQHRGADPSWFNIANANIFGF